MPKANLILAEQIRDALPADVPVILAAACECVCEGNPVVLQCSCCKEGYCQDCWDFMGQICVCGDSDSEPWGE
jgi:hypothetical protein